MNAKSQGMNTNSAETLVAAARSSKVAIGDPLRERGPAPAHSLLRSSLVCFAAVDAVPNGVRRAAELQMPSEIHVLMQDAHDKDAVPGLAVEDGMACGVDPAVSGPDLARVASQLGEFRQRSERFVQPEDVPLGAGEAPPLQGEFGNRLHVGSGFARQDVASHAWCRCVPSPPPRCRGRCAC